MRGQPRQIRAKPDKRARCDAERPGRDIDPSQCAVTTHFGKGGQKIVAPRVKQRVFGQGPRGHQTDHITLYDRFRASFLGFGRAFQLLTDGHAEPFADQGQQVVFRRMRRHAAHWDVLPQMFAPFGQRNIQGLCRGDRVVKEHLVEIAHAVEKQRVGVLRFYLEKLRHHGRY